MDIMKSIPLKSQEEINPVKKGDYLKNGLLYCGVCGKPKQYHLKLQFIDRIVPAICDCQKKAIEEEKQQIAAEAKKNSHSTLEGIKHDGIQILFCIVPWISNH